MSSIVTSHVLDTQRGAPAEGVRVTLSRGDDDRGAILVAEGRTDADGRVGDLLPREEAVAGQYRLVFEVGAYFEAAGTRSFYPVVEVVFRIEDPAQHYHVPLLVSPFQYTTYRGS